MCVRFAPMFWGFNICGNATSKKWLIIYCSPIIHKWREPTQNRVIQFLVTKRGQIFIWIWISKPQPTIGSWLCLSFHCKSELHTLHRDLSFDAILRAFFVVRLKRMAMEPLMVEIRRTLNLNKQQFCQIWGLRLRILFIRHYTQSHWFIWLWKYYCRKNLAWE